jgi:DNA helicase-2/ATP-dependent DNA helicase PcrA
LPKPAYSNRDVADDLEPDTVFEPQFSTGQKVRHARFGEGTVIESKPMGNDEQVSVAFPGIGVKRLAASFAKLEKLEE